MTVARSPRAGRWLLLAVGAAVLVLLGTALAGVLGQQEHRVEVPAGTGAAIADGATIELLPAVLEVRVGDRLVIVNDDDVVHEVGPYVVAPGQTLQQTFTRPGTLQGACTLHPSGEISIVVR